jgi:hypothetical protein
MSYGKSFTLPELIELIGDDHFLTIAQVLEHRRQAERTMDRISTVSPHEDVINATRELASTEASVTKAFMELGIGVYSLYRLEMNTRPRHTDTQTFPAIKPDS